MSYMLCTPAYGGMVTAPYMRSVLMLAELIRAYDKKMEFYCRWNESLVNRARNGMAHEFLKTDYEYLFWVDADISFSVEDFVMLDNIMNDGADIGVGVYRMKTSDSMFAAWVDGKLVTDLDQFGGPVEVDYAGTGFMMISRHVFEGLADKVEEYENEDKKIKNFFGVPVHDGVLESEDYHFCRIAREAGFKVIMDPAIRLKHWGFHCYD